jgi:uncharacterized membrane protein YidH (DUF202 family)
MTALPDRAGLQPERTALAWQRTAITAAVVMVPLVVVNAQLGSWVMTVLSSVATIVAGVLVVGLRHRFAQLREDGRTFSPREPMVRVAAVATLSAVIGVGTALVLFLR